jgi:hypothetical protein
MTKGCKWMMSKNANERNILPGITRIKKNGYIKAVENITYNLKSSNDNIDVNRRHCSNR